ncbi:MAG TPA: acyltransferase [Candidatus Limnocylindrales bacterium]|nr:acyltransferase [Candidatus Limnocylindrales bacterium]
MTGHVTRRLLAIPGDLLAGAVAAVPGSTGRILRRWYWGRRLGHLGARVAIDEGVRIDGPAWVSIGDDCWIDRGVILIAGPARPGRETRHRPGSEAVEAGRLTIGERCHIGPYSVLSGLGGLSIGDEVTVSAGGRLYSLSHHYRSFERPWDRTVAFGSMVPDSRQSMVSGPIAIGSNVGFGADCMVLPGVTVGGDSFVLPRAILRDDIAPGSLVGGDPARVIGPRFSDDPTREATA